MNGNTRGSRWPLRRSPLRRLGARGGVLAAVALLAAACGGGGSGGSSSGGRSTTYQKELAYSECMRANGVPNFPDPGSNGIISIQAGGAAGKKAGSSDHTAGGSQMSRADSKCRHLLPNGGVPTAAQQQQLERQGLKFAECMRAHGISNFPDPSGSGPTKVSGSINLQSPQFQAAQRACQRSVGRGGGGIRIAP